jgi:hypothetical protein
MTTHHFVATLALMVILADGKTEALKSGPQVGDRIPGPFNPYNVTGEDAGLKRCQV